jgi:predicted RNA-binding protein with PUA-like domain
MAKNKAQHRAAQSEAQKAPLPAAQQATQEARRWLLKSEPQEWSWAQHAEALGGAAKWDGVRNHQATAHLKAMRVGDLAFFYHTGDERRIVGVLRVVAEFVLDPADETGKFGYVVCEAVTAMPRPVTLAQVKAEPAMAAWELVRNSRLSVMPVPQAVWDTLCGWGGLDADSLTGPGGSRSTHSRRPGSKA